MKNIFCSIAFASAALVAVADPVVSGVSASLAANDNVYTVSYTLTGAPAIVTVNVMTNGVSIGGEHIVTLAGDVNAPIATDGVKSFTWDVGRDWDSPSIGTIPVDIVVSAWTKASPPDVMVLDLVANSSAPVKYYESESFLPGGLLSNADYRVNKLVMKRCHVAGDTFELGVPGRTDRNKARNVTFDHDFYLAVFEFTQGQWEVLTGVRKDFNADNPGNTMFTCQDWQMRPCQYPAETSLREAKWNVFDVSKANPAYRYPHQPFSESLFGLIHTRTGIWVDLPSENQFEVAARPGHTAYGWYGVPIQSDDNDPNFPERYKYNGGNVENGGTYSLPPANCGAELGTAKVGSYKPNAWGFYDMCGNVSEYMADGWANPPSTTEEPHDYTVFIDAEKTQPKWLTKGTSWNGNAGIGFAADGQQGLVTGNRHLGFRPVSNDGFRETLWK